MDPEIYVCDKEMAIIVIGIAEDFLEDILQQGKVLDEMKHRMKDYVINISTNNWFLFIMNNIFK